MSERPASASASVTTSAVATLVLIALAAVVAPILSELTGALAIPEIVIQIGLGLIGPYVLNLADVTNIVTGLSDLGLTFLIFLAGYELDLRKIRGKPLQLATAGWAISLLVGLAAAFALVSSGLARDTVVVGLALTTTALGTLVPMLRDAGSGHPVRGLHLGHRDRWRVRPDRGRRPPTDQQAAPSHLVAVGGVHRGGRGDRAVGGPGPAAPGRGHARPSSRIQRPAAVRVSLLFIVLLVLLAQTLGLDVLLGAFAAGIVVQLFSASAESEAIRGKLEAIGFGFLIPIFFVVGGIQFDAHVFVGAPELAVAGAAVPVPDACGQGHPRCPALPDRAGSSAAVPDGSALGHRPAADRGHHQHCHG